LHRAENENQDAFAKNQKIPAESALERGHVGENLRGCRVKDLGFRNYIKKVHQILLEMEINERSGYGRNQDDEKITHRLLQWFWIVFFVCQETPLDEFTESE
jgi:hypothetical protein